MPIKPGFAIGLVALIMVAVITSGAILGYMFGVWKPPVGPITTTITGPTVGQGECPIEGCILQLAIKWTLTNKYDSAVIDTSGSAMTIIKLAGVAYASGSVASAINWEQGDTDSSGIWTTSKGTYKSGERYRLLIANSNTKYQLDFEVPRALQSQQANFPIDVTVVKVGTFALGILEPDGTTAIANNGSYNVTTKANTTPRFGITISNSVDESGVTGPYEDVRIQEGGANRKLAPVLTIKVSESSATPNVFVKDWTKVAQVADAFYYLREITAPADWGDRDKLPDGTLDASLDGTSSFSFQADATALPAADTETIAVTYYIYLSVWYFGTNNGATNTEAVSAATISFSIRA